MDGWMGGGWMILVDVDVDIVVGASVKSGRRNIQYGRR